jgi:SAM-dependent methyltransferase
MIRDRRRNDAYLEALRPHVASDTVVLDLGAGLGLFGIAAARLGARRVFLVDPSPVVLAAIEVVRANGMADRVEVIQSRIEDTELPERVDLIVSVLTGNFLLEEDLLSALFHARDRFLKEGGTLVPAGARMLMAALEGPGLLDKQVASWSEPSIGVDFSPVRRYAANTVYPLKPGNRQASLLSEPSVVASFDFHRDDSARCDAELTFTAKRSGICHGLAGWFELDLDGRPLGTSPWDEPTHWSPLFFPMDPPLTLAEGQTFTVRILRPERGDWSWEYRSDGQVHRRSTFLSRPLDPSELMANR